MNNPPQQTAAEILRGSALATLKWLDSEEADILTLARAAKQSATLAELAIKDGGNNTEPAGVA